MLELMFKHVQVETQKRQPSDPERARVGEDSGGVGGGDKSVTNHLFARVVLKTPATPVVSLRVGAVTKHWRR